jgi:hypothetical protein
MLIGANLPDDFSCFSMQHSGTINNQMLHRMTGKVPAKVLTGRSIPLKDLHPFGCPCKVLHKLPSKRTHSAQTSGNLRETDFDQNAINLIDTNQKSSFNGTFLGFGNHHGILLVLQKVSVTSQTTLQE